MSVKQEKKMLVIYVAGKYTGYEEKGTHEAELVSIELIKLGFAVLTPHKNTYGYEKYEDERIGYMTWINMYLEMLSRCDVMYVLRNWKSSAGVGKEIEYAVEHGIPIVFEDEARTRIDHCRIDVLRRCACAIEVLRKL